MCTALNNSVVSPPCSAAPASTYLGAGVLTKEMYVNIK